MPRIIAGAFAGTARSTCRVPRQNLGHRESAGWPVSVRALFLFYLKNYNLNRRKSFHDKDTVRSPKQLEPRAGGLRFVGTYGIGPRKQGVSREAKGPATGSLAPARRRRASSMPKAATEELHHGVRYSPRQPGSVPRICSLVDDLGLLGSGVRRSWEGAELEIKVAGAQSRHVGAPPRSVPGCGS